jgi:hypothetical protein
MMTDVVAGGAGDVHEMLESLTRRIVDADIVPTIPELTGKGDEDAARLLGGALLLYEAGSTPFVDDGIRNSKKIASILEGNGLNVDVLRSLFKYVPRLKTVLER